MAASVHAASNGGPIETAPMLPKTTKPGTAEPALTKDPKRASQAKYVSALVLKLRASNPESHDTNNPARVETVLRRALLSLAEHVPDSPFAKPGAQAAVRIQRQMSGGAVVISLGHSVSIEDAQVLVDALRHDSTVDYAELDRVAYLKKG